RGPYRSKRRRNGAAFSGWRAALPSGLLGILFASAGLLLFGATTAFAFFTQDLPSPQDLARDPLAQSTRVYDRSGNELLYQFEVERREIARYEDMPKVLVDATVSAEDKSFWSNPGVDVGGIVRAVEADLSTLTLAEAALLAGLPQSPSVLDPSHEENQDRAKERRQYVLDQMVDTGAITQAQADLAAKEPIKTAGPQATVIKAPHFVFQVRNQLAAILGCDEAAVSRGGYKVTTTLDMTKQEIAERRVREWG